MQESAQRLEAKYTKLSSQQKDEHTEETERLNDEHTEETERLNLLIRALHKATNIQIESLESSNSSSKTAILPGKSINKIAKVNKFMVDGKVVQVRPYNTEPSMWCPGFVVGKYQLYSSSSVESTGENAWRYVIWYVDEKGAKQEIEVTGPSDKVRNKILKN